MEMPVLQPAQKVDEWILMKDWSFYSKRILSQVTVKEGFRSDLDSIPRIPILYSQLKGYARLAAIAHDWLYRTGAILESLEEGGYAVLRTISRREADKVFNELMKAENISTLRRWFIYQGVRAFGWIRYRPDPARVETLFQHKQ